MPVKPSRRSTHVVKVVLQGRGFDQRTAELGCCCYVALKHAEIGSDLLPQEHYSGWKTGYDPVFSTSQKPIRFFVGDGEACPIGEAVVLIQLRVKRQTKLGGFLGCGRKGPVVEMTLFTEEIPLHEIMSSATLAKGFEVDIPGVDGGILDIEVKVDKPVPSNSLVAFKAESTSEVVDHNDYIVSVVQVRKRHKNPSKLEQNNSNARGGVKSVVAPGETYIPNPLGDLEIAVKAIEDVLPASSSRRRSGSQMTFPSLHTTHNSTANLHKYDEQSLGGLNGDGSIGLSNDDVSSCMLKPTLSSKRRLNTHNSSSSAGVGAGSGSGPVAEQGEHIEDHAQSKGRRGAGSRRVSIELPADAEEGVVVMARAMARAQSQSQQSRSRSGPLTNQHTNESISEEALSTVSGSDNQMRMMSGALLAASGTVARCVAGKTWNEFDLELLNKAGELRKLAIARIKDQASPGNSTKPSNSASTTTTSTPPGAPFALHNLTFELQSSEALGLQLLALPPPQPPHVLPKIPTNGAPRKLPQNKVVPEGSNTAAPSPRRHNHWMDSEPGSMSGRGGRVLQGPRGIVQHWELRARGPEAHKSCASYESLTALDGLGTIDEAYSFHGLKALEAAEGMQGADGKTLAQQRQQQPGRFWARVLTHCHVTYEEIAAERAAAVEAEERRQAHAMHARNGRPKVALMSKRSGKARRGSTGSVLDEELVKAPYIETPCDVVVEVCPEAREYTPAITCLAYLLHDLTCAHHARVVL